jgi:hypothetical protein
MQVPELPVVTLKHIHRTRIILISTSRALFRHAYVPRRVASSISNRRLVVVGFRAGIGTKYISRMLDRNTISRSIAELIGGTDTRI